MSFHFQRALRQNISLLVGLSGGTGSGKTFSAMRLAKGLAGDKPFAVIDTEAGRARFYADLFQFDCGDLVAPFTPSAYTEAIIAADKAGYPVVVVDSASHGYAGDGGILDMQEAELDRMAGDDWKKREACKMASWIKPKMQHKAFLQKLLQVRAHVILCFRAEQKIEMVREGGKTVIREKHGATGLDGWFPVTEKSLPFELTVSFLLLATAPGVPHPIKLPKQHQPFFPADHVITEEAGIAIGEWAAGGTPRSTSAPTIVQPATSTDLSLADDYMTYVKEFVADHDDPAAIGAWWNSAAQKEQRQTVGLTQPQLATLQQLVRDRIETLKKTAA